MNKRYQTATCPHCGAENLVRENGRYVCNGCEELFDVDWFEVAPVKQPDDISCGWATTLWLLRSFGKIGNRPVIAVFTDVLNGTYRVGLAEEYLHIVGIVHCSYMLGKSL